MMALEHNIDILTSCEGNNILEASRTGDEELCAGESVSSGGVFPALAGAVAQLWECGVSDPLPPLRGRLSPFARGRLHCPPCKRVRPLCRLVSWKELASLPLTEGESRRRRQGVVHTAFPQLSNSPG